MRIRLLVLLSLAWAALFAPSSVRAIMDIPAGEEVLLEGIVNEVRTSGFQIFGKLRLETIDDAYEVKLIVTNGVIANATNGTITINPGAGGTRSIAASIVNDGQFNVNFDAFLLDPNGYFIQRGEFNVSSNRTAKFFTGGVFSQDAGTLKIDGLFQMVGFLFRYNGGLIAGSPQLFNGAVQFDPAVNSPASFVMSGTSQLMGDLPAGQSIWIAGNDAIGAPALLSTEHGFVNTGTLRLESFNGPGRSALLVNDGVLTNGAAGVINVQPGQGGARAITARLVNQGQLNINHDLTVDVKGGGLTNAGNLTLAASRRLTLTGDYEQSLAGTLRLELSEPDPDFGETSFVISGDARLDGQLQFTLPDNVTLSPTSELDILRCNSRTGYFNSVTAPPLTNGMAWKLNYKTNAVTLQTTTHIETPTLKEFQLRDDGHLQLLFTGSLGGGYILQTSTNLADWESLHTNQPFGGIIELVETNISQIPYRFYRVVPVIEPGAAKP